MCKLVGHRGLVYSIAVSTRGKLISIDSYGDIFEWDLSAWTKRGFEYRASECTLYRQLVCNPDSHKKLRKPRDVGQLNLIGSRLFWMDLRGLYMMKL